MFDKIAEVSLLYDFYGKLLTNRQRDAMQLYHEENLTLAEIADEFGISRQGVHDALKNAEKSLNGYEEKLGLVAKFQKSTDAVQQIDIVIDDVIDALQDKSDVDQAVIGNLKKVKDIIDNLEE